MDIYAKLFFTWVIGFLLIWGASLELYPLRCMYPKTCVLLRAVFAFWVAAGLSAFFWFLWFVA